MIEQHHSIGHHNRNHLRHHGSNGRTSLLQHAPNTYIKLIPWKNEVGIHLHTGNGKQTNNTHTYTTMTPTNTTKRTTASFTT